MTPWRSASVHCVSSTLHSTSKIVYPIPCTLSEQSGTKASKVQIRAALEALAIRGRWFGPAGKASAPTVVSLESPAAPHEVATALVGPSKSSSLTANTGEHIDLDEYVRAVLWAERCAGVLSRNVGGAQPNGDTAGAVGALADVPAPSTAPVPASSFKLLRWIVRRDCGGVVTTAVRDAALALPAEWDATAATIVKATLTSGSKDIHFGAAHGVTAAPRAPRPKLNAESKPAVVPVASPFASAAAVATRVASSAAAAGAADAAMVNAAAAATVSATSPATPASAFVPGEAVEASCVHPDSPTVVRCAGDAPAASTRATSKRRAECNSGSSSGASPSKRLATSVIAPCVILDGIAAPDS